MKKHALHYLKKGFSVIPIGDNKKPLIEWKKYQEEKPLVEEIEKWWEENPTANIGLVTGKISNISVVDIDNKSGGLETLKTLGLPITWTVKTGGGGWHYYYKYSPNAPQGTGFYNGVDVRNDGGYVVAPPSGHNSGNKYEWTFVEGEMEDFPETLFVKKEQNNWKEIIKGSLQGTRNDTAAKICGKLMTIFNKEDWEACVWSQVKAWNIQNTPPLEEKELRSVYESIAKKAVNNTPKNAEEKIKGANFVTFTEVLRRGRVELENTKPEDVISYGYNWLDNKLTGIFPSELTVIGGESGTGKTTFATNIIYKASNKIKCGVYALEDRLEDYSIKALFFKVNRLKKGLPYPWNDFRKNKIKDSNFQTLLDQAEKELANGNVIFSELEEQMDIETLEGLIKIQARQGVKLFLIDHLHYFDLTKGKNTKADHIEQTMVRLKTLLNNLGVSMLLVVHYRKLNGQKPTLDSFKDSISIVQNSSYVINLWRDRGEDANPLETLFLIPKARNPNGEGTVKVEFDPSINDYKSVEDWKFGTEQLFSSSAQKMLDDIKF